jgi:hypothetical protein
MDEEFGSFVVTDPDIVDPGIDVSGLRTQTDTSLLGNIPDFAGIQYEAFNPNRLSDLMRLYSTGLPIIDTPAAATPPDTGGGDSGDGGQGTIPGFDDPTPELIEVAPGEIPITSDDVDAFNEIAITPQTEPSIEMENISIDPYNIPMDIDDPGASIENIIAQNPSGTIAGAPSITPLLEQYGPTTGTIADDRLNEVIGADTTPNVFDYESEAYEIGQTPISEVQIPGVTEGDLKQAEIDAQRLADYTPSTSITPEDTEQSITQKIADFLNVDTDKLNKAAVTSAINLVAGKALDTVIPIATVFNLVKDSFTKSPEEIAAEEQARQDNIDEAALLTEISQDEVTPQDIIDDRGRGQIPTRTEPEPTPVDRPTMADIAGPSDDKDDSPAPTSPVNEAGLGTESISDFVDDFEVSGEAAPPTGSTASDSFFDAADRARESDDDSGPSAPTGPPSGGFQSESTYDAEAEDETADDRGGGNGGNGGGKIVCTMMNESYGFGSFRNKIWLKHSKDLAPEYQKGYHKIFLPLVRLSKNNKILKKMLEHIAVHRTIDIRQESRGKVHLLGRVYRKILEPICYWVGKYAK